MSTVISRHDPATQIQYLAFAGAWPTLPRDLCIITRTVFADDKSIFIFTTSVEHQVFYAPSCV